MPLASMVKYASYDIWEAITGNRVLPSSSTNIPRALDRCSLANTDVIHDAKEKAKLKAWNSAPPVVVGGGGKGKPEKKLTRTASELARRAAQKKLDAAKEVELKRMSAEDRAKREAREAENLRKTLAEGKARTEVEEKVRTEARKATEAEMERKAKMMKPKKGGSKPAGKTSGSRKKKPAAAIKKTQKDRKESAKTAETKSQKESRNKNVPTNVMEFNRQSGNNQTSYIEGMAANTGENGDDLELKRSSTAPKDYTVYNRQLGSNERTIIDGMKRPSVITAWANGNPTMAAGQEKNAQKGRKREVSLPQERSEMGRHLGDNRTTIVEGMQRASLVEKWRVEEEENDEAANEPPDQLSIQQRKLGNMNRTNIEGMVTSSQLKEIKKPKKKK